MIINEIRHGGINLSIDGSELLRLARLMDRAAYHVQESLGYGEDVSDVLNIEALGCLFTSAAVACKLAVGEKIWFERVDALPTFHTDAKPSEDSSYP